MAELPFWLRFEPLKVCAEATPARLSSAKTTRFPSKVKFFLIMRLSFRI
jgi:hypothetical protein